jgi:outer membrane protein assembly factor BamB
MRRRLLLILAAAVLLVLGTGIAVLLTRHPPGGTLETNVTDVTVVTPSTTAPETTPKPPKPKPPQTEPVDRRCWTMFGGGPRRTLARPGIDLGVPVRKPMWARGLKGYIEYPASYCDGVLYVNTFKGDTWAIEAATGKVLWRKLSDAPKPSTPAIAGDKLIVSSKDGTVTALTRKSGKVVWQLQTNAKVESSAAVAGATAYFGATDGRLFAVDVDTGHVRWAFDTGGRINASPSLADGRVCITTYAGSIFCLRQRNGEKLWSTYVKRDAFRYESFYASASTDGRRLYTIARSGKIVALNATTGDVIWTDSVNSLGYSTPAVGTDRIFVGDFNGGLRAYRKTDGRLLWRAHVGGRILGPPVVVGDLVFFSTLETETYAARASDGKIVWHYGLGKYSPGIATERAYYFSLNGMFVAFRGKDGPRPGRASSGSAPKSKAKGQRATKPRTRRR